MSRWGWWVLAVVVVIRLAIAVLFPVMPEEAYHWNFGRHPDWCYLDHPPMIAWSIEAGRTVFGDCGLGVRLVPTLFALGTMLLLARLARQMYGPVAAAWTIAFLAVEPAVFTVSSWGFPDSPLLFFWALALTGVWQALDSGRGAWWLLGGAALGAAMLSKYTAVFLVPAVLIHLLSCRRDRHWLWTCWPYLAGVVALVVFAPVLYWNWTHDWASFHFQGSARFQAANSFSLLEGLKSWGEFWLFIVPFTLPLALAAAIHLLRSWEPRDRFLFWTFAPMAGFFMFMGCTPSFHLLWTLPAFLSLSVAMAGAVAQRADWISRAYADRPRWFVGTAVASLVLIGLYTARCLPGLPPIRGAYGWEEVAARAREERSHLPPDSFILGYSPRPYWCASELAYHLREPGNVYGNNILGGESLQYRFWGDPKQLAGRDAIVVVDGPWESLALTLLRPWFSSIEPAIPVVIPADAQGSKRPLLTCLVFRAHGYHPVPDESDTSPKRR
jgi:dolichol-phosphate mannosyltransferase